jgi:hypothetical protein
LCLFSIGKGYAQYDIHFHNQGFIASLSLTAMFTTGVKDRSGFRLGVGLTVSQTVDRYTFSLGADACNDKKSFGLGTGYAGIDYNNRNNGASYYLIRYFQGNPQTSGIIHLYSKDFQFRFEDDILAYPFVGFKVYDRYRTAAMEVRYKGFMLGTNVFTTDIDGLTDFSTTNTKGTFRNGKQISSPLYVGYTSHDLLLRLGINNQTGGWLGQNFWHKLLFQTPDFKSGNYSDFFLQTGIDKPYTLY